MMNLSPNSMIVLSGLTRAARAAAAMYTTARLCTATIVLAAVLVVRGAREDTYNILWAVVFGFATLNILGLAARRTTPGRRGLSFGELLAVLVVIVSIFLLGWEMLYLFHVFPVKLRR